MMNNNNMYKVNFQHSEYIYCVNIAISENIDLIKEHYAKKYQWYDIVPATESDIEEAKQKGMPIINFK